MPRLVYRNIGIQNTRKQSSLVNKIKRPNLRLTIFLFHSPTADYKETVLDVSLINRRIYSNIHKCINRSLIMLLNLQPPIKGFCALCSLVVMQKFVKLVKVNKILV